MGNFFSNIFANLFGQKELRILILGLDGAGTFSFEWFCGNFKNSKNRKNDNSISAPGGRGGDDDTDDWVQCGNGHLQKSKIPSLGSGRTDLDSTLLGMLVSKKKTF